MDLSRSLLKEFAKVTNDKPNESELDKYQRGTAKVINGKKFVLLDGSNVPTPISETVDVQEGDRVLVTIENHKATILGNFSFPPSARKEQEAVDKSNQAVEQSNTASQNAQSALQNANQAITDSSAASALANEAKTNASQAITAAQNAEKNATAAKTAADTANTNSTQAKADAAAAQQGVANANAEIGKINKEVTAVQGNIDKAVADLNTQAGEIAGIKQTYSTKVETDQVKADLSTEISTKVGELSTTVAQTYAAKGDLTTMEGKLQTQITQNASGISSQATRVDKLESDTATAQQQVSQALKDAAAAQNAAKTAQTNAATAQAAADAAKADATTATQKATAAQTAADAATAKANAADKAVQTAQGELNTAKQNLVNVTNRVGATEKEIADAQAAVNTAQQNVNKALADAATANNAATKAQTAADKAQLDASTAQNAATTAQQKADSAKAVADKAQADATKANADVAALTKRVTTAETSITQNADAIALNATKTTEIGTKLDNLKIGGRNLIYDSAFKHKNIWPNYDAKLDNTYTMNGNNSFKVHGDFTKVHHFIMGLNVEPHNAASAIKTIEETRGKDYTFSLWVYLETLGDIPMYEFRIIYTENGVTKYNNVNKDYPYSLPKAHELKVGWNRLYGTYSIAKDTTRFSINFNLVLQDGEKGKCWVSSPKVEEGTRVTDWTPAPEDIQNELSTNYYSKTEADAKIKVAADQIKLSVSETYTAKDSAISSQKEEYYISTNPNTLAGGSWSAVQPTWQDGKYIWRRTLITYGDNKTIYIPSDKGICIQGNTGPRGPQGSQGIQGPQGDKGLTGDRGPAGPQGQTGATGATGPQGPQGNPGKDGATGKGIKSIANYYLASTLNSGVTVSTSGWTTTIQNITPTNKYLWNYELITYTDSSTYKTAPCIIGAYGEKGQTGATGLQGPKGDRGPTGATGPAGQNGATGPTGPQGATGNGIKTITEYYQVSTSNTTVPTSWVTSVPTLTATNKYLWNYERITYTNGSSIDTTKRVIGVYGDKGQTGATGPQGPAGPRGLQGLQGPQGNQGIQGPQGNPGKDGTNGQTSYFHIKYSAVAKPTSASQMTETPSTYIGTYVDFTQADSTDPNRYTWSRFAGAQGPTGAQGIPGKNGSNGQTSYLHIAYANSSDGSSGFSTTDSANKLYIGQYTDFVVNDSTDYKKYKWSKIKGETGATGDRGPTGAPGQNGVGIKNAVVTYQASNSQTTKPTGTWLTSIPKLSPQTPYLWTKTVTNYTDGKSTESYSVSSTLEGVEVGGRNLLLGTKTFTKDFYTHGLPCDDKVTYNGLTTFKTTKAWTGPSFTISKVAKRNNLKVGDICTIQAMVMANFNDLGKFHFTLYRATNNGEHLGHFDLKPNEWYKISVTFTLDSQSITEGALNNTRIECNNYDSTIVDSTGKPTYEFGKDKFIWIAGYKLELGNTPTDWTPAPEDVEQEAHDYTDASVNNSAATITEAYKSLINETSKQITLMVDKLREVSDGHTSSISSINNQLQITSEMAQFVKTTTEKLQSVVDGKVSESQIREWARFDGATLELGASNQPFKCKLSTTELAFYQGTNKVAWISNNELNILTAIIAKSIGCGNFTFVDEGSLGFSLL